MDEKGKAVDVNACGIDVEKMCVFFLWVKVDRVIHFPAVRRGGKLLAKQTDKPTHHRRTTSGYTNSCMNEEDSPGGTQ